jgi:hypothetical protein
LASLVIETEPYDGDRGAHPGKKRPLIRRVVRYTARSSVAALIWRTGDATSRTRVKEHGLVLCLPVDRADPSASGFGSTLF